MRLNKLFYHFDEPILFMTPAAAAIELPDKKLREISDRFEDAEPRRVLEWALKTFGDEFAFATGFGAEGCLLISLLAQIDRRARIFYLDTDVLFPETYELRDELEMRYNLNIERRASRLSLTKQAARFGSNLWETAPDECCNLRKVEPLREILSGLRAWGTAIRREQSPARANAGIVERDKKFGIFKINPLANWTIKQVWRYIFANDVPYNRLHNEGYRSIGCLHCTSKTVIGEAERAGRWRGKSKTECGLHQ